MFSHRSAIVAVLPLRLLRAPELPLPKIGGLPRGRLIELTGGPDAAQASVAVQIVLASQREGDPVAWIQPQGGELFPPDLAGASVELASLLVVHVPKDASAGIPKAAELVLRTGAFGAVVLDLTRTRPPRGEAWLGRLSSLAREHDARCVLLGPEGEASLGPLVSLRFRPVRTRVRPGLYRVETEVLKDKSGLSPSLGGPPSWRGPEGMP
jgi:hypothetical protein